MRPAAREDAARVWAGRLAPQASPPLPRPPRTQGSHTALEWRRGCDLGPLARRGQRPWLTTPTEQSEVQRIEPKQPEGQLLTRMVVPSRSGGPN